MRLALLFLAGCDAGRGILIDEGELSPSSGWVDAPIEQYEGAETTEPAPDYSAYDDATLRIVAPGSGAFLAIELVHAFEATLTAADGALLDASDVTWTASLDVLWGYDGASFDDDTLDVGLHDLTASVELPNGDRLAHTVGGVLVQSLYAGTYSGLFSVDGEYTGLVFTCSGVGLIITEPYGEEGTGDADCLVSILGIDLPLAYVFELDNVDGVVTGTAGADIFGLFTWDFPAEGTLTPDGAGYDITFGDTIPLTGITIDGSLTAARVSLDSGL